MPGQGCFPGVVGFGVADFGAGVGVVAVVAVEEVEVVWLTGSALPAPAAVPDAADAPAMPLAAPPATRAPATIVAPSILETFILGKPPGWMACVFCTILGARPKATSSRL